MTTKKPPAKTRIELETAGSRPALIETRWNVFLRVAELGSLSKAASALDMSQSIVSRHIALLEQQCGERLFHRTGRGVVLTELGQHVMPRATQLIAEADALLDDILSARGEPAGEVVVGLLPTAVDHYAGRLFKAVGSELPNVRLRLVEGASAQLDEHIREGRLDMAMVLREDETAIGDSSLLATIPLHLVGLRGDPLVANEEIALANLATAPLVIPSRPHLLRARLDRLAAAHGLKLRVAVEADSVRLQLELVAAGAGYAIASAMTRDSVERFSSSCIVHPVLQRFIVLAQSPKRPGTRASQAVHRLMRRIAQA